MARGKPDRSSVESCKAVLAAGQVLALYPEGRLGTGPLVGPLSDGAVFIAASTQATIVPVGVAGLERFRSIRGLWRPDTVRVVGCGTPAGRKKGNRSRGWLAEGRGDRI